MINYNFAVFILSHGRANNVVTLKTLKKTNYSGKIYLVCDDEDDQLEDYKKLSGVTDILTFSKTEQMKYNDTMDNFKSHKIVLYARNTCFDWAKKLGLDYFLELDDDYSDFEIRYVQNFALKTLSIKDFDSVINSFLDFYSKLKIKSVAFAQGGDLLGGAHSPVIKRGFKRKVMNSFFFKTTDPCSFIGSINEDTNLYVSGGIRGDIYLTIADIALVQGQTQANAGGLTDQYLQYGTYVKSFYSVMIAPSCVKVKMMNSNHQRLHHSIAWNNCTPCIISDKYKKA